MYLLELFPNRKIYLVDTYKGIPFSSKYDSHRQGDFADVDLEEIKTLFKSYSNVSLLKGIFPKAFKFKWILNKKKFAIAHLDVDVYQSYQESLRFLYPKMVSNGIIFLDDYMEPSCEGATRAIDEFFADKPEKPQQLKCQWFILKN